MFRHRKTNQAGFIYRFAIWIPTTRYGLYANFKDRVLEVAKNEIKDKCKLYFNYQEIRTRRKVIKISNVTEGER